jgi:hypothetical protein
MPIEIKSASDLKQFGDICSVVRHTSFSTREEYCEIESVQRHLQRARSSIAFRSQHAACQACRVVGQSGADCRSTLSWFGRRTCRPAYASHCHRRSASRDPLAGKDLPWLAGAILAGGVAGPALLLLGLLEDRGRWSFNIGSNDALKEAPKKG